MMYRALTALMRHLASIVLGDLLIVEGRENVPRHRALLVVSNHVATLDPPLTGAFIPRLDVHYLAKSEHFTRGSTRWLFYGYHAFPVLRGTADRQALNHARDLLRRGHAVVIYPEGARSWDGRLRRPHPGAGFLARHTGAVILPVAVWGTEHVITRERLWPRRAAVHVCFGPPFFLPATERAGRLSNQRAADEMMRHVAELLPLRYRGIFNGETDIEAVPPAAA
ncbi:MAG: lysophospholipid acyltransferase family protein [Candidatus Dormibacteria bacterium]